MNVVRKITREPALVVGLIVAVFGLCTAFGLDLTREQVGAVVTLAGAVMALVRFLTTPSAEVAVQVRDGEVIAGPAAVEPTGTTVAQEGTEATVTVRPDLVDPGPVD